MNHSIRKVRKCSDFISSFPFSISFCVAQQNREQETPGDSGLDLMSPAQADHQLSHIWIPRTPKNVVCWARALQKSVSSKLLSSEAPWNCCQPPRPTLPIVFKGFLTLEIFTWEWVNVCFRHSQVSSSTFTNDSWYRKFLMFGMVFVTMSKSRFPEEAQPQRESWAVGRKDPTDNYL